jgi:hypothetical protein
MGSTTVPLPDLDTENTDVQSMIVNWVKTTVYTGQNKLT